MSPHVERTHWHEEREHWRRFVRVHLERGNVAMARGAFNRYVLATEARLRELQAVAWDEAYREAGT